MTNIVSDAISQVYMANDDIVDDLITNNAIKPLSANQGKALKDLIGNISEVSS